MCVFFSWPLLLLTLLFLQHGTSTGELRHPRTIIFWDRFRSSPTNFCDSVSFLHWKHPHRWHLRPLGYSLLLARAHKQLHGFFPRAPVYRFLWWVRRLFILFWGTDSHFLVPFRTFTRMLPRYIALCCSRLVSTFLRRLNCWLFRPVLYSLVSDNMHPRSSLTIFQYSLHSFPSSQSQ
jgi:hypothetical protein